MKKTNFVSILLGILLIPNLVLAQAKDVYKSLKKIEAMMEVGTNYKDYINALQDAQLEVNLFKEGEGREKKELLNLFEESLLHYKMAGELLNYKRNTAAQPYMRGEEPKSIGTRPISEFAPAGNLRAKEMLERVDRSRQKEYELGRTLLKLYPEASDSLKSDPHVLNISKLEIVIFNRAQEVLKKISELMTQQQ